MLLTVSNSNAQCSAVTLELGIHVDHAAYNEYNGDIPAIIQDVEAIVSVVENRWSELLGVPFDIVIKGTPDGLPIIWETPDPFCCQSIPLHGQLNSDWNMHRPCIPKDGIFLFTGKNFTGGGGSTGDVCDDPLDAVAIGWVDRFGVLHPSAMHFKFAHEIGHFLSAPELENSDCGDLCDDYSLDPLMCSDGVGSRILAEATLDCIEEDVWSHINDFCSCFGPEQGMGECAICFETAMIEADNLQPIPGCGGNDIINYTVTICNSCDAQDLKVQVNFAPNKLEILSGDFPTIVPIGSTSLLTTNPALTAFAGEECKVFSFSARVKEGAESIGTGVLINGSSLGTQPLSYITISAIVAVIGQAGTTTSLQSQISGGTMLSEPLSCGINPNQRKLQVEGTLEIDVDYCLRGYQLVMKPASRILVKSGVTLTVDESTKIRGCDQMWQGIALEDGATLNVDNSTIEDAQYAILATGNGNVSVTNSVFNNNFVGIYFLQSFAATPSLGAFFGNAFDGGSFLPPYPGQSSDPASTIGGQPFAGVWINRAAMVNCLDNTFDGLANGIYVRNANLKISGSKFTNITENGYNSYLAGNAVWHSGSKYTLQMTGLGGNDGDPPTISGCTKGVRASSSRVDYLSNCNISTQKNSIEMNVNNIEVSIKDNTVRSFAGHGISTQHPRPSTQVFVINNEITVQGKGKKGILANSFGTGGTAQFERNRINLQGTSNIGIELNSIKDAFAFGNTINFQGRAQGGKGIAIQNNESTFLQCNTVTGGGAADGNQGFYIWDAESGEYSCNQVQNIETGAFIAMGSSGPEAFTETTFGGGGTGLRLAASAAIGQQTHKGNRWTGSFGGFGAEHLATNPTVWNQSTFTVHTTTGSYYPSLPPGQNLWFPTDQAGSPSAACLEFGACDLASEKPDKNNIFDIDDQIIKDEFTSGAYEQEMGWLAKRYMFRKLNKYPDLLVPGSDAKLFFNQTAARSIGQFYDLETRIKMMYEIAPAMVGQLEANYSLVSTKMEEAGAIDQQMQAGSTGPNITAQRENALRAMEIADNGNGALLSGINTQRAAEALSLAQNNHGIMSGLLLEDNEKTVNGIYMSTVAIGELSLDQNQINALDQIAAQCPLTGGSAVFKARSILSLVSENEYDNEELCGVGERSEKVTSENDNNVNDAFLLFPNPAKQQVLVTIDHKNAGVNKITIYDLLGKELIRQVVPSGIQSLTINISALQNGLHLCSLFKDGKKVASKKLMVLK